MRLTALIILPFLVLSVTTLAEETEVLPPPGRPSDGIDANSSDVSTPPDLPDSGGLERQLVFHASYDKTHDADFAKGCPAGSGVAEITRDGSGISGEALIARHGFVGVELYEGVKYLRTGNLPRKSGTVEFHFKPLPGFFKKSPLWRRIFICSVEKTFEGDKRHYRWFRIDFARKKGSHMLRAFEQDTRTGHGVHLVCREPKIAIGKWRHVTYSWDDKSRQLRLDGILVAQSETNGGLPLLPPFLHVGALPCPRNGADDACSLIDELKIWSQPVKKTAGELHHE